MSGLVVDTSALVAIINGEPEAAAFLQLLISADRVCLSTATAHELNCVMQRYRREDGPKLLAGLLEKLEPEMLPFDAENLVIANNAYETYGRGSKHAAALNMADCYAYALAKAIDLPLLFKGNDFIHTDVRAAAQQAI
jgi:ribonuclease VapC